LALAARQCYLTFFFLEGQPKGSIFCSFTAMINARHVPSDTMGGRGVELICNSSGEGLDDVFVFFCAMFFKKYMRTVI
jgi:hypothetical protein